MSACLPISEMCTLHQRIIFFSEIIPYVTNGLSHPYHLDGSTFILRGIRSIFVSFIFHFSIQFLQANRISPDGTPRFAASHLGLFCLPMSHKMDDRLIWVKFMP